MLSKHKRWFHSSRVKFPLITMSASWVFGVNVFDLDLGVQIDAIEQPIKSSSVGSGNMSHCGVSSLHNHFDHCFVIFKHIQQSFLMRRLDVRGNRISILHHIDLSLRFLFLITSTSRPVLSEIWDTLPWTEFHSCSEIRNQTTIGWLIVQICSLTIECLVYQLSAKYKHFRTIWEHIFGDSPTPPNSSLKWWSSMHGIDTL